MKLSFKIGSRFFKFVSTDNSVNAVVDGVNSNISKGKNWWDNHILMIDYDDMLSFENLVVETKRLQRKFKLNHASIFESSYHHYHVIYFWECMDYFDALKVLHDTPCDYQYKMWRMRRECMTLRLSDRNGVRPKLIKVVNSFKKPFNQISMEQLNIYNYVMDYGTEKKE